jgi:hypothetical protein
VRVAKAVALAGKDTFDALYTKAAADYRKHLPLLKVRAIQATQYLSQYQ